MRVSPYFLNIFHVIISTSLVLFSTQAWTCDRNIAECIYSNGKFAPYEVKFSTETSAGGLNVDVGISQRLEKGTFDNNWEFRTKITGFIYGLYGSVVDSSDFTILADNSYQTKKFSRKARVYGMIPIAPTSFKQKFEWDDATTGRVKSKYRGDWYKYGVDHTIIDQAILPLQLRQDLVKEGPDLGIKTYKATSKKHVDDDFMVRYVEEVELQTPLGTVPTVIYELLKGHHKKQMNDVAPGHDISDISALLDQLITLRNAKESKQRDQQIQATSEQLNALLKVDQSSIVSISEDEAKSARKSDGDDKSVVSKASEIEEGNARVFFWLSKKHAYLPVKMLAVIDSNAWSKVMITSIEIDDFELSSL
jgi:hypothetical protein